jgi:DNA polymerase-3 subunit epsilon
MFNPISSCLVFDTETTDLMPQFHGLLSNIPNDQLEKFPHIIQFSSISYSLETQNVETFADVIIKIPEHVEVTVENTNIHGITKGMTQGKGVCIETTIENFMIEYMKTDLLVGHNISFDKKIVCIEIIRIVRSKNDETEREKWWGYYHLIMKKSKNSYCTMSNNTTLCNLFYVNSKGKSCKKPPKLIELFLFLFPQQQPTHLHNSLYDCFITLKCYIKVTQKYDLSEENEKTICDGFQ